LNCSPPKAATQGLMPPEPTAMRNNPIIVRTLKENVVANHFNWKFCTTHLAGKFHDSMAPMAITKLPATYTTLSHKIVLNFPHLNLNKRKKNFF